MSKPGGNIEDTWAEVTKSAPCLICGKPDWCSRSGEVVRCMRIADAPCGWRIIKPDSSGGTVFALIQDRPASQRPRADKPPALRDWGKLAVEFASAIYEGQLTKLACQFGVTTQSLVDIGVGWSASHGAFTFPEYDAAHRVVGIATRSLVGKKFFMRGGKRGLTLAKTWQEEKGPVLLVEGPSDVTAALSVRLRAIGRPSNRGGAEQIAELCRSHDVLVVGENDQKPDGRWPGKEGAEAIAAALAQSWKKPVRFALPPEDAKDIRGWLVAQQVDPTDDAARAKLGQELIKILESRAISISPAPPNCNSHPYRETPLGLVYYRTSGERTTEMPLTNFRARIVADILSDDGVEEVRFLEIEASIGERRQRRLIAASRFASLQWVTELLGARAYVYPGQSAREHARTAIQALSPDLVDRRVFAHTGWRELDGRWVYLHRDGAIGSEGQLSVIRTELPDALGAFRITDPPVGEELLQSVRASLGLLELGPAGICVPLLCAIYRSVLDSCDFTVHLTGATGAFKTELATLAQQHFGSEFNARNLPPSWSSTANYLETVGFTAKDALVVVDDFAPTGNSFDRARLNQEADRLLRAQGNRAGRGRLSSDGTPRPAKPPRGLILSTGEDVPRGKSLRARMFIVEITPGEIESARLSLAQQNAREGRYVAAMSGFLKWLAPQLESVRDKLHAEVSRAREQHTQQGHRRTPDIVSHLAFGGRCFLDFALAVGAIDAAEHANLLKRIVAGLQTAAQAQGSHLQGADPVDRFQELLSSALILGVAHLTDPQGRCPTAHDPDMLGWRRRSDARGEAHEGVWQPRGGRVGWITNQRLWLDPSAAFSVAQRLGESSGEGIPICEKTLWKRMAERGLLVATDDDRNNIKRVVGGKRRRVLELSLDFLSAGEEHDAPQTPARAHGPHRNRGVRPDDCPDERTDHRDKAAQQPTAESANGHLRLHAPIAPIFGGTDHPRSNWDPTNTPRRGGRRSTSRLWMIGAERTEGQRFG